MENLTIRFYRQSVYGNEMLYPVDHRDAIKLLTGQVTLTHSTITGLEKMGFKFQEVLKSSIDQNG